MYEVVCGPRTSGERSRESTQSGEASLQRLANLRPYLEERLASLRPHFAEHLGELSRYPHATQQATDFANHYNVFSITERGAIEGRTIEGSATAVAE